jgi:hypothetical protein
MNYDAFIVPPGSKISLRKNYDPAYKTDFHQKADAAIKFADRKWFTRLVVANIICTKLEELNLQYPTVSEEHRQQLLQAKLLLEQEDEQVNSTDKGNKK